MADMADAILLAHMRDYGSTSPAIGREPERSDHECLR